MSSATIDYYLRQYNAQFRRYNNTGTSFGRKPRLKHNIPLKQFSQKIDRPGYVKIDTVAHCGGMLLGKFRWLLTVTDVLMAGLTTIP